MIAIFHFICLIAVAIGLLITGLSEDTVSQVLGALLALASVSFICFGPDPEML